MIDTDTDSPVPAYDPLSANAVLDRSKLPVHVTIRANTNPLIVGQVNVSLDGVGGGQSRWPSCLTACDVKPGLRGCPFYDYLPSELSSGSHVLTATPLQGKVNGTPLTLSFSVMGSSPPR